MEPFPVVEQLDVPENGLPHVFDVLEVSPVGHLLLEACEEAFHAGVVVGTPRCAHREHYPILLEHRSVAHAAVLHATVGMEGLSVVMAALHEGIGQRALDKFGINCGLFAFQDQFDDLFPCLGIVVDFFRKSYASVMPDHKQACVGRNTRLVDFCHCFTFLRLHNEYSSLCYPLIKLLHSPIYFYHSFYIL